MSNRVYVDTATTSCGNDIILVWDGYGRTFVQLEGIAPDIDLDLLKILVDNEENDEILEDILDYVQRNETGCHIRDSWYPWEQISEMFKDSL